MFKKAFDAGEDPYLALLNLRNTPRSNVHSPASILMGRNLRTNIPCSFKALIPKITYKKDKTILEQNKIVSKQYYDKTARKETKFKVGESVLFQKIPKTTWTPGTIQAIGSTPRSFMVQGEKGGVYSRNSSHITPREKVSDKDQTNMSMQRTEDNDNKVSTSVAKQKKIITNGNSHGGSPYVTKAGRTVIKPDKFKDYIK